MSEELCNAIARAFGDSDDGYNVVDAIRDAFVNGGVNFDMNLVEAIDNLVDSNKRIADAITPNIAGNTDATGGHVSSLTEAVMGVAAGLVEIAEAIRLLAQLKAEENDTKQ